MSKFSVLPLLAAHFDTLRDASTGKARPADYIQLYGLPIAVGATTVLTGFQLQGVGELLAGIAILGSLLFGLVIFVIQLRLQMTSDPRVGQRTTELVDELFANVTYAVLVGLVATAVTMAAAASRVPDAKGDLGALNPWWTGAVAALTIHLLLMIGMALKRVHSAYQQLAKQRPLAASPTAQPCAHNGDHTGC